MTARVASWALAAALWSTSFNVATAQGTSEEQALVLAQRAALRFESGNFAAAVTLLREAISLHETPALQLNLARTLVRLERWQDARDAYARYLVLAPESPSRVEIQRLVVELDERVTPSIVEPPGENNAAEPDAIEAPAAPAARRSTGPWILSGGGVALAAVGVPLTLVSRSAARQARSAPSQQAAVQPASDARSFAIAANVLYSVGGALVLTGVLWRLLSRREPQSVSVEVFPGGASVRGQLVLNQATCERSIRRRLSGGRKGAPPRAGGSQAEKS